MTIITQDGRTLNLSRQLHLSAHAGHTYTLDGYIGSEVTAATFKKKIKRLSDGTTYETGDGIVARYGVLGTYSTRTGADKAVDMLQKAWQNGATEFIMPQDNGEKSEIEIMEDFAEANNLTLCSINEVGYRPSDVARNLHIWRTTNEFERRNIIICDRYGDYSKSLAKWQALQACSKATEKSA